MRQVLNCAEELPGVRFPVNCPLCARELLTELPAAVVAKALAGGSTIRLYASCHDVWWDATALETEQIREYFSAARLASESPSAEPSLPHVLP
jgi:hypothetical protein